MSISYALFRRDEFFDARKELRALGKKVEKEEIKKKDRVKKWKRERLEEMEMAERMELFMVWQEEENDE